MDILAQMADQIIKRHEKILGKVAYSKALKVPGIVIDPQTRLLTLNGNGKEIIEKLIWQYEQILGKMSIQLSKDAIKDIISQVPQDQVPQVLLSQI